MAAYMFVDFDIHDQESFQTYVKGAVPLIAKHGGKVLVSGGDFEVIDGKGQPHRLALMQFSDRAAIRAFFADPHYLELNALPKRFCESVNFALEFLPRVPPQATCKSPTPGRG